MEAEVTASVAAVTGAMLEMSQAYTVFFIVLLGFGAVHFVGDLIASAREW